MQDSVTGADIYRYLFGAQGYGKNLRAKEKLMQRAQTSVPITTMDNGRLGVGTLHAKPLTALPPKVCYYGKPKLYWFGELHGSNNFVRNDGYTMARHWNVIPTHIKNYHGIPGTQLSMWPATPMGSTTGRNPLEGKKFIGISEPDITDSSTVDNSFLKRFTGDEWVETKTLNAPTEAWKPQGKLFIMSGKPLKINDKSKELIERVKEIEFPEAP